MGDAEEDDEQVEVVDDPLHCGNDSLGVRGMRRGRQGEPSEERQRSQSGQSTSSNGMLAFRALASCCIVLSRDFVRVEPKSGGVPIGTPPLGVYGL